VRFGRRNEVRMSERTRERVLASASGEDLVRWHCIAAEWFADHHPDDPERLVHLARGRRSVEAAGLVRMQRCRILDSPDRARLAALVEVCRASKDPSVVETTVMLALSLRDVDAAREAMSMAPCADGGLETAAMAEMAILEGDCDSGLRGAIESYTGDPESSLRMARGYLAARMPGSALPFIRHAKKEMCGSGCLFGLDEAYRLESLALMRIGDYGGALERLDLAGEACTDGTRGECIGTMRS
jgi:hypothetical protein